MNKKTILNRTLPLIIALVVILVVAVSVTIFAGDKKTPAISTADETYLTVDLGKSPYGYDQLVKVNNGDIYRRLKNGENGLTCLVDMLDKTILTEEKYLPGNYTNEELTEAVEEAIFGAKYEFDEENFDADVEKIENFIEKMYLAYGLEISKDNIEFENSKLTVAFDKEVALKDYYTLILARKAYTRDQMGVDQEESYKEFIEAYEEYLTELYKYENDEVSTAPTAPSDASIVTSSNIQSEYEDEYSDSYWTLLVSYDTQSEAEKALLQVGVVNYNSKYYVYEGVIDLNKDEFKDENGKKYETVAAWYKDNGTELGKYDFQVKLVELYNNSKNPNASEVLVENTHYTKKHISVADYEALAKGYEKNQYQEIIISEAEYNALTAEELAKYSEVIITAEEFKKLGKAEKALYTEVPGVDGAESTYKAYNSYKAIIFKTEVVKDDEGKVDEEAKANALYFTKDRLSEFDSSVLSYVKSLSAAYAEDAKWESCYTKTVQAKGAYYILAVKYLVVEVADFEEVYGTLYDEDKYEEDGTIDGLGYVDFTVNAEGEKEFDFANSQYWKEVQKVLDDSITTTRINEYMAKLRNEYGLIIYDEKVEASYTKTYTSDYELTKKSSKSIVAKLVWEDEAGAEQKFEVKADDLYNALDAAYGAITAVDAYQYENILYQNEVIDYGKYKAGASLSDCVIITEYALAAKGSESPVTSWVKANSDAEAVFTKVDGTKEYDVLVRKGTDKKDAVVEKAELEIDVEDNTAAKTTITVTVSDELDYQDPEAQFKALDEQITMLKLAFTNGQFATYGYEASYGWKNFLKDYFETYYGIEVVNNNDVKLYYIYEATVADLTEDMSLTTEEAWNEVYLPNMQAIYDKYFSVDAEHFLISVSDEEGLISDPNAADTAWTAEQKAAAEELYNLVYKILKKTKKESQATVLKEIVDAFDSAPKFVYGVDNNTEAQENNFASNDKYFEMVGEPGDQEKVPVIEYTETFKGIELEISKYKTLGLEVKYEDLSTVTADKMVAEFENALKLMWDKQNKSDSSMQEGGSLESNELYINYSNEYLVTEFGYHVLMVNSFTGRSAAKKDSKLVPVTLPTLENVLIYEKDDEEVDNLSDYEIAQIETYYEVVKADYTSSYWYQINVLKEQLAKLNDGSLAFTNEANKAKAIKVAEAYVSTYYESLSYIKVGYEKAVDYLEAFAKSANSFVTYYSDENGASEYAVSAETLVALENVAYEAAKAIAKDATLELAQDAYNKTKTEAYNEALEAYKAAKALAEAKGVVFTAR